MKKKLLFAFAMLLCVATVFTSCSSTMRFSGIFEKDSYEGLPASYTGSSKVDLEGDVEETEGDLVVLENIGTNLRSKFTVYNIADDKTVWSASDSETKNSDTVTTISYFVEPVSQYDVSWFYVVKDVLTVKGLDTDYDKEITLYDASGTQIATASGNSVAEPVHVEDLIRFDGKVYRIAEDKTISEAFEMSELRDMPNITQKAGKYYIAQATTLRGVLIYDSELELTANYSIPSYADTFSFFALNNGNVLIQYDIFDGEHVDKYTYIEDGDKYQLKSFLLNAKNGSVKELDLEFVVHSVDIRDGDESTLKEDGFKKKIENLALVSFIDAKRLDGSFTSIKYASLSNNGKLKGTFDDFVDGMLPGIVMVAQNRWTVENLAGQAFLLNEKGKVIGEISNNADAESNENYLIFNNKIYNWDLELKYDMNDDDVSDYIVMDHSVIFETDDEAVMIYADGEVKTLISKNDADKKEFEVIYVTDGFEQSGRVFAIVDSDDATKYTIYNDKGESLYTCDGEAELINIACVAETDGAILLAITQTEDNADKTVYVRVS